MGSLGVRFARKGVIIQADDIGQHMGVPPPPPGYIVSNPERLPLLLDFFLFTVLVKL